VIYIYGEPEVFDIGLSFKYFLKDRYGVNDLMCHCVYQITPSKLIFEPELIMLKDIFNAHNKSLPENGFYLQPPFGQISPWGLKFTQMIHDLNFHSVQQVERFFYISMHGKVLDFYTQQLIAEYFKPQLFYRSTNIRSLPNLTNKLNEWISVNDLYDERLSRILKRYDLSGYQVSIESIQQLLKDKKILPATLLAFCSDSDTVQKSVFDFKMQYPVSDVFIAGNNSYVIKSSNKRLISTGMSMNASILSIAMKLSGYILFEENHGGHLAGFALMTQRIQRKKKSWASYSQQSGIPIPIVRVVEENKSSVAFSMGLSSVFRGEIKSDASILLIGIPKMSRLKLKNDNTSRQDYLIQEDPYFMNPEIMRRLQSIFLSIDNLDVDAVSEVMSLACKPLGYHMIEFTKSTGIGFNIQVDQIPRVHDGIRDEDLLYQPWDDALVLLVNKPYLSQIIDIFNREVCPYQVIGLLRSDNRMCFISDRYSQPILDISLPEYQVVEARKQDKEIEVIVIHEERGLEGDSIQQQLIDWLYYEDFLDPQANLMNIDVSCYGHLVQGMMIGPWQTAVNQVVVLKHGGLQVAYSLIVYHGTDIVHLIQYVIFRMLQYNIKRDQVKVFLLLPLSCTAPYIKKSLEAFSDIEIQWKQDPIIVDMYANVSAVIQNDAALVSPYVKIENGENLYCIAANSKLGSIETAYEAIIAAQNKGYLNGYVALDQCLWGALLRMLFSSRLGANIDLSKDTGLSLVGPYLGALVQISDHNVKDFEFMMPKDIHCRRVAKLTQELDIQIQLGHDKIDMNLIHLRKIWSKDWIAILSKMARESDEYFSVDQFLSPSHKGLKNQKLPERLVLGPENFGDVKIAILRDRGSFGHFHLARILTQMGVGVVDVTYTDLIQGKYTLKEFQCLLLPGGATYGDEGSAGLITAKKVLSHVKLSKEFEQFFLRSDTLVLGFGNGGQILAYLQELIPDAHWPIPQKNVDNEFHSRKFLVDILPSPCVVLKDLENTRLMTSFGCRFGHISKVESKNLICAITKNSVIDSFISVENNPLHNDQGAYGFTTNSGRVSWFLFHPEYHIENHQYDFYQPWVYNQSPWAQLFNTMMNWLVKNRQAD